MMSSSTFVLKHKSFQEQITENLCLCWAMKHFLWQRCNSVSQSKNGIFTAIFGEAMIQRYGATDGFIIREQERLVRCGFQSFYQKLFLSVPEISAAFHQIRERSFSTPGVGTIGEACKNLDKRCTDTAECV
jgi:hypothetical protein